MRLRYAKLSTTGPVRPINEDWIDFWEPQDPLAREKQGSVALLADGVGGFEHGEVASHMAVDEALKVFQNSATELAPYEVLRRMFNTACMSVHDAGLAKRRQMATTLVASIFRSRTVFIAHVGDSRAYLIRQKKIRRLTTDHAATTLPVKLRLVHERQAMASPQRSQLTRSVGTEPFCQPDFTTQELRHGDFILHCTDGLHAFVLDEEICEIISRHHPYDACRELEALTLKRGGDDNISLQVLEVRDWEKVATNAPQSSAPRTAATKAGTGELAPGLLLDNRFELTDLIARSNMASIFKANDRKTGGSVALKVPLMTLESDVAGYERFQREEEIGSRLNHPAVLKVIKVDGEKSRPYLVMEFLDGITLAEMLAKKKPLPETEAVNYASRICEALEYLHANGIVHRDLKPQNVMVCRDGSIRLFDFGIARVEKSRRLTFVGFSPAMGTPDYMSPEQVKGKRGDARSDIYSLGAMLYEMAAGSTPFEGESPYVIMNARVTGDPVAPRKLNPKITPELEEIILHALERDPRQRYPAAAGMKHELDDYKLVTLTQRHQYLRAPQPWKSSQNMTTMVVVFVALTILMFFAMYLFFRLHH
ncbi:MAG TPA: protein kinase [Opitutaceae bacterium]|nr:protein kinase [Opitutaceae bacterium]